eukprot:6460393-Amphidinium_carterae.2
MVNHTALQGHSPNTVVCSPKVELMPSFVLSHLTTGNSSTVTFFAHEASTKKTILLPICRRTDAKVQCRPETIPAWLHGICGSRVH